MRLLIHVEGETEEMFVAELLREHLVEFGWHSVEPRLMGNARLRSHRGGIKNWPGVRSEIIRHLRQDAGCFVATFADYYAMPQAGEGCWPGRGTAATVTPGTAVSRGRTVQIALVDDIATTAGQDFNRSRFVPFVAMHEFEGLLFSDCRATATAINRPELTGALEAIRASFSSPEEINDSPTTAPSKRLMELVPNYQKPLEGTLAALSIGIPTIRRECPHFNSWLTSLEMIPRS